MEKCLTIPIFGFVLCWIFNSCCKEEIEENLQDSMPKPLTNKWHCAFINIKKNKLDRKKSDVKPTWNHI